MNYVIGYLRSYPRIFGIAVIAGVFLLLWGTSIDAIALVALGGAWIGTSLTLLIGHVTNSDFRPEVLRLLSKVHVPGLWCEQSEVDQHRAKFHHYCVTEIRDKLVWRYCPVDFSDSQTAGRLTATAKEPDKDKKQKAYRVQAGFFDDRMITLDKAEKGTEPVMVHVYPYFEHEFEGIHCGLVFKLTYDETRIVAPCIMSRTPIVACKKSGPVSEAAAKKLDIKWRHLFFKGIDRVSLGLCQVIEKPEDSGTSSSAEASP